MIDVVFQLLIYFLLGTNFVMGEQAYHMDLPERLGESQVDPFELDEDPIVIEVRPRPTGNPTVHIPGPWTSPTTIAELRRFLASKRRDQGGLFERDHPIKIRPMPGATWGDAVEAFNAAYGAGYESIGFDRGGGT
jgi:biopolymer transport protein ExbD